MPSTKNPLRNLKIRNTPDPDPPNNYYPRSEGKKYGLGICQFWVYIFELNERLPKKRKMTDEEIKRQVREEYPNRKSIKKLGPVGGRGTTTVNYHRQLYNGGRYTRGIPPKVISYRYGADGNEVNPRTGKPLT